jgi:hypothetical protein
MMRSPAPLPGSLASAAGFTAADAATFEVGRPRLRRRDLTRVFSGVHAARTPTTFHERAAALLPRLEEGQVFSHATAAGLHGMPVPQRLVDGPLHVSALYPAHAPRIAGVVAHRLIERPGLLDERLGYPITSEHETWSAMAGTVSLPNLVAMGDHLVRKGVFDPTAVLVELEHTLRSVRRVGIRRAEQALTLIRPGVRSAMESIVRVLIVLDGIPEPEVNVDLFRRDGGWLGEGDLVYRLRRLLLEYEGDGHRTDRKQFRKDITRREDFEDEGWSVFRITADDVFRHRRQMLNRLRRRLGLPERAD